MSDKLAALQAKLQAEKDANLHAEIQELQQHIESLQNTVAQVTAENVLLSEYVDADMTAQKKIKKLQEQTERQARMILRLEAVAERYRFLRDNAQRSAWEVMLAKPQGSLLNEEQIDAAVDAAREGE